MSQVIHSMPMDTRYVSLAMPAMLCNAAKVNQRMGADVPHDACELSAPEPHDSPSIDSVPENAAQTPSSAEL